MIIKMIIVAECGHEAVRDLPVCHEVRAEGELRLQRGHDRPDPQPDPGSGDAQGSSHCKKHFFLPSGLWETAGHL